MRRTGLIANLWWHSLCNRAAKSIMLGVRNAAASSPYALSSDQVCSPHAHLNMRTVRPFWGLSILRSSVGFSPQLVHVRTGLGSKLEKTSFLNSSFM